MHNNCDSPRQVEEVGLVTRSYPFVPELCVGSSAVGERRVLRGLGGRRRRRCLRRAALARLARRLLLRLRVLGAADRAVLGWMDVHNNMLKEILLCGGI